ncbi:uncharacterized protein LOC114530550 [Dendronephthya gigantea]|uniref:uncharacterized protein LOC114530550 n=1 Tax=Dendronephthya gigantea TaxID=151771 RepID=UPI0010697DDA|nr:uncharacterized protein LOC114530550 [Dendronephthya gigantea]
MESHKRKRKPKSIPAMVFLTLISVGFLLFGLVTVVCGFVLNYHANFKASEGGERLKLHVEAQFDYTQYWLGFPFLITGALSMVSGMVQKDRSLTIVTFVFLFICVILSLFAMILEGVDWVEWNNRDRLFKALKTDDYRCETKTQTQTQFQTQGQYCVCNHMGKEESTCKAIHARVCENRVFRS